MATEKVRQISFTGQTINGMQLPDGSKALFLSQHERCFISGESSVRTDPNFGVALQTEHIIPKLATRQHPRLLKPLRDVYENIGQLCSSCHHKVDRAPNSKMDTYRNHGVFGLMEWLAIYYPRSADTYLFTIQHLQWQLLFRRVQDSFSSLKDEYPPHLASDYSRASALVNLHLDQWQDGRFK